MERKLLMKKIIALIIVIASVSTVWAVKQNYGPKPVKAAASTVSNSQNGPRPANPNKANPLFDLVATGDFKLEDALNKGYPVIINFSATWCGPCQRMKPIFKEANKDYAGKAILKTIDVDDPTMKELVANAGVSAIPHQIFFFPDGSMPTPETCPELFEKFSAKEIMIRRTFSKQTCRTGGMDRETIDGIIKALQKGPAVK